MQNNSDLIKNLDAENNDLSKKLVRLVRFLNTEKFINLNQNQKNLLIEQKNAMQVYSNILLTRIDDIKNKEKDF